MLRFDVVAVVSVGVVVDVKKKFGTRREQVIVVVVTLSLLLPKLSPFFNNSITTLF